MIFKQHFAVETTVDPPFQTALEGQKIYFICQSVSNAIWTFGGGPMPLNVRTGDRHNDSWLEINNVRVPNSGIYSCFSESNLIQYEGFGELFVVSKFS